MNSCVPSASITDSTPLCPAERPRGRTRKRAERQVHLVVQQHQVLLRLRFVLAYQLAHRQRRSGS